MGRNLLKNVEKTKLLIWNWRCRELSDVLSGVKPVVNTLTFIPGGSIPAGLSTSFGETLRPLFPSPFRASLVGMGSHQHQVQLAVAGHSKASNSCSQTPQNSEITLFGANLWVNPTNRRLIFASSSQTVDVCMSMSQRVQTL